MSDHEQDTVASVTASPEELQAAIQDINVGLTFEIGRDEMTLAKLQTLQPGYVFELAARVQEPVTIRANGKAVATGELLDVDGRIGVRLTETSHG